MLSGSVFFILYDILNYGLTYLYDFSKYDLPYFPHLLISAGTMYLFLMFYEWLSNLTHSRMMGGADAKLLLVLSIIFPIYPVISNIFPIIMPMNMFGFSVLGNALAVSMIVPIGFLIYNLFRMGLKIDKPLYAFIGYKTKISDLANKHIWLIQEFEEINGKIISRFKRGGLEIDENSITKLKSFQKKGLIEDDIWVTPKLPFMIPISIGFFIAIIYGDILFELVKFVLFI
jgi:preflagellin peptidase FlaK